MSNWGLLSGAGKAMQNVGMQMREDAINARKQRDAVAATEKDQSFRQGIADKDIASREGISAADRASREKVASMPKSGQKPYLDPMVESRINSLDQQIKSITGSTMPSEADQARLPGLINELQQLQGSTAGPAKDPYLMDQATAKAEKWANDQAKWNRFDETDFKDYGGNRQEAIHRKSLEYYNDLSGAARGGSSRPQSARPDVGVATKRTPSQEAIEALLADPTLANQFEEYFGVDPSQYLKR